MAALRSLSAVAALALVQSVHGWNIELPPCTSPFLPFVYTGCFQDPSTPNALSFRSSLDTQSMTVEKCVAECKGNGYRYAGLEYVGGKLVTVLYLYIHLYISTYSSSGSRLTA